MLCAGDDELWEVMHQWCNQLCADVMLLPIHVKLVGVGHQSTVDLRWRLQQETAVLTEPT